MKKESATRSGGPQRNAGMTIGRERFGKISAVEGIVLTPDMKKRADDFDRKGVSAEERRRTIVRAHRKG